MIKYFIKALAVKMASAVLMALVYQYYYNGGGDTHTYFTYVQRIRDVLYENKTDFLKFIFLPPSDTFLIEKYFGVEDIFFKLLILTLLRSFDTFPLNHK